jgi:NCS1 family nucleobase:cation symporter-1
VIAWVSSLLIAFVLNRMGLHLFFLLIPTWFSAMIIYTVLASLLGANEQYADQVDQELLQEAERKQREKLYLDGLKTIEAIGKVGRQATLKRNWWFFIALACLLSCLALAILSYNQFLSLDQLTAYIIWPTLIYFISATRSAIVSERQDSEVVKPR